MFAAVEASRAIKRSGGRRKGRAKLLELSSFTSPYSSSLGYYNKEAAPRFQKSRTKDAEYSGTIPWSGNYRHINGSTNAVQFVISGLPLICPPGTSIYPGNGVMSYHADREPSTTWQPCSHDAGHMLYYMGGNYVKQAWRLYCVAGSTVQRAKYRLAMFHIYYYGRAANSNRYNVAMYSRFNNTLANGTNDTNVANYIANRANRGYTSSSNIFQGRGVFSWGAYLVYGNHSWRWHYPLAWRIDLSTYGLPGHYIEFKR